MLPGSISSRHLKSDIFQISLSKFLRKDIKYQMIVGDLSIHDLLSATRFPDYVDITILSDTAHVVPLGLKDRGISIADMVKLIVNDFSIKDQRIDYILDDIRGDVLYHYLLSQADQQTVNHFLSSGQYHTTNILLFNYIRAKTFYNVGEKEKSLEIITNKILISNITLPWDMYHFIGLVYRDLGVLNSAIAFFEKSHQLYPQGKGNLELISRGC